MVVSLFYIQLHIIFMKVLSLFANVGFGEFELIQNGFNVVVANELLDDRVDFYKKLHPQTKEVIAGDISQPKVKECIVNAAHKFGPIDIIIATPPCQGMSLANAKKASNDPRNTLIVHAMEVFLKTEAKYMLIENVPNMPETYINHEEYGSIKIADYIKKSIPENFQCHTKVLNGKHFNTPQERKRSITLISQNRRWDFPDENLELQTLKSAIGHLPSLEANCSSPLKWHFSSKHNERHVDWMKHTASGNGAYFNALKHYPCCIIKNDSPDTIKELIKNGSVGWHTNPPILIDSEGVESKAKVTSLNSNGVVKLFAEIPPKHSLRREIYGFTTAYKRMSWNKPAPTVTMTNGSISSQNNVHPGCLIQPDGIFSDARALTVREILLLCGLSADALDSFAHNLDAYPDKKFKFKSGIYGYDYHPSFIRKVLGELFLPKMASAILNTLHQHQGKQLTLDI